MDAISKPIPEAKLRVVSLGAGVQSTTLCLMAAKGKIGPMPDCAIFADTGWEPKQVYEHLDWLEQQLPFPIHRVTAGDLRQATIDRKNLAGGRFASIPFYTEGGGLGRRQCTREYKVAPIEKKQRELLGFQPRKHIPPNSSEVWIGISTDEIVRMKDARRKWQRNRWPLIEQRMSRGDCIVWLEKNGFPVPAKSACIGCPYHNDALWAEMKREDPTSFKDAVYIDNYLRHDGAPSKGMAQREFMHSTLKPLEDVKFSEDRGQMDMFLDECDGLCGT